MAGFIYFIKAAEVCAVQIRWSRTPEQRRDTLAGWSPVELTMALKVPGTMQQEAKLHAKFERWHRRGEWFHACDALLQGISLMQRGGITLEEAFSLQDVVLLKSHRRPAQWTPEQKLRRSYMKRIECALRRAGNKWAKYDTTPANIVKIFETETHCLSAASITALDRYLKRIGWTPSRTPKLNHRGPQKRRA